MRAILRGILVLVLLLSAFLLYSHPRRSTNLSYAAPPRWIVLCGIQDRPCVTYIVVYHLRTQAHGDSQGEGVDYKRKTISLTWSNDRFKNVEALEHEVIHAALWERGFVTPTAGQSVTGFTFLMKLFPCFFTITLSSPST